MTNLDGTNVVRGKLLNKPLSTLNKIPVVSIFMTNSISEMNTFYVGKSDPNVLGNLNKEGEKKSFLFNRQDSNFISLKHDIGFNEANKTHIEIQLLDPGREFELNFIDAMTQNRNIYQTVKKVYITYGVGDSISNWARPILGYITNVDVSITSKGARVITLNIAGKPSLLTHSKDDKSIPYIQMGQPIATAGIVSFYGKDIPSNKENEKFIDWLDEAIFLCIQRYIENISQYKGNVIVLLPSMKYSSGKDKLVDSTRYREGAQRALYGSLSLRDARNEIVKSVDRVVRPLGLMLSEVTNSEMSEVNKQKMVSRGQALKIERASGRAPYYLIFQSGGDDDPKNENKSKRLDWEAPLKAFGIKYMSDINTDKWAGGIAEHTKCIYREVDDIDLKKLFFNKGLIKNPSDNCAIWGVAELVNLFMQGYQETPQFGSHHHTTEQYRPRHGSFNGGATANSTSTGLSSPQGNEEKSDFISREDRLANILSMPIKGGTIIGSTAGHIFNALNDKEFRSKMAEWHSGIQEGYTVDVNNIFEGMNSLISNNDISNYIDFNTGKPIPIFRANVANADVTDVQVKLNPTYWTFLLGVSQTPIIKTKIEEVKTLSIMEKLHKRLKKNKEIQRLLNTSNIKGQKVKLGVLIENIIPELRDASEGKTIILEGLIKSLISNDEAIFSPISPERLARNLLDYQKNFYNQLHNMYYQTDLVCFPKFSYSSMLDLLKPVFLYAGQPTILGGSDGNPIDKMALQSSEDIEKSKKYYSSFFTGFYKVAAFEHIITKTSAESHFRLLKSQSKFTNKEIDEFINNKKKKEEEKKEAKKARKKGLNRTGKEKLTSEKTTKAKAAAKTEQASQDLDDTDDLELVVPTTGGELQPSEDAILLPQNEVEDGKLNLVDPPVLRPGGEIDWSDPENMPPEIAKLKPIPMNSNVIPLGEPEPRTDITLEEQKKLSEYASEQRRVKAMNSVLENNRHLKMEHLTKSEQAEIINEANRLGFSEQEQAELLWEKNAINQRGNPMSNNLQSQYENSPFGGSPKWRSRWEAPFKTPR
jgi:hypothetical protein